MATMQCTSSNTEDIKIKNVDPSNADKHWQTSKTNTRERNEFMLNNELMSDVKFRVGESKTRYEIFYAHRYVLGTASPVFFAMLFGNLANSSEIEINDTDPESFMEFLRYIYCDHASLSQTNVFGILYLAKKYIIPSLGNICISYLMDNISVENVLEVLQSAWCYCEEKLERNCWCFLSRKTIDVIQSESFLDIDRNLLSLILKKDNLSVNEVDLFNAVKCWSKKECVRSKLDIKTENQKKVIGDIIYLIRFPVMSAKEFAEGPARSGLLDNEDVKEIFIYLNAGIMDSLKFPLISRVFRPFVCSRYTKTMRNYLWRYEEGDADSIKFKVSEIIYLSGIGLYGAPSGGEYSVVVTVCSADDFTWSKEKTFTCPPDPNYHRVKNPRIYEIMFDVPLRIQEDAFYTLTVLIQGPPSFGGDEGQEEVTTDGVKFDFENSKESSNGTSFDEGQIPTLLFHF
eukprot:gene29-619_t